MIVFRWRQPRRKWKDAEVFTAWGSDDLVAQAMAALWRWPPQVGTPLVLQSLLLRPSTAARGPGEGKRTPGDCDVVFEALPAPAGGWPYDMARIQAELRGRALDLFVEARRRLELPTGKES